MNRSLWLDPAMLALSVVNKGYGELFGQLELRQSAPVGFLLVSKLVGSLFGYKDLSLTVVPFLFGIASLILFLRLSCRMLGITAAPLAFLPFAACSTAVLYSGEFKQYSGDLFFSVLLLLVAHNAIVRRLDGRSILAFVCAGLVGPWFSHTAILVAAGTGMALIVHARARERRAVVPLLMAGTVVVGHFLALYLLQMRPTASPVLFTTHAKGFAPLPVPGSGFLHWWWQTILGFISHPLGFGWWRGLPLIGMGVGAIASLFSPNRRTTGMLLLFPLVVLAAVSTAHFYPIHTGGYPTKARFVLFAAPFGFLLIAVGLDALSRRDPRPALASAILACLLAWLPFDSMIRWPRFRR